MSRKTLRPLIIGGLIVALLAAAALIIYFMPEGSDDPVTTETPSETPKTSSTFISDDYLSLTRISITPRDGETRSIAAETVNGVRELTIVPAADGWTYKQDLLRAAAYNASGLNALSKITGDATDSELDEFGLSNPSYTVRVDFNSESKGRYSYTFFVGNLLPLEDSYYVVMKDSRAVYAVSSYGLGTIIADETYFRNFSFFPEYLPDESTGKIDTAGEIQYIRILNAAQNVDLEVRYDPDATEQTGSAYRMLSPVQADANDSHVVENLHNTAVAIKVGSVVTDDPSDEQLSECGFDTPRELWLEDMNGNAVHYIFGTVGSSGDGYVMVEGCTSLMLASNVEAALFVQNYLDYMFKMLITTPISDVEAIAFTLPDGARHLISITEYQAAGENQSATLSGQYDGRAISQTNISRAYYRVLNMTVDGELDTPADISGNADLLITIRLRSDAPNKTFELYRLNERHYAASIDGGEAIYWVNASTVKHLIEAFDYLDKDEEIPRW